MATKRTPGIRPSGNGIRITIYGKKGQKAVYDRTIPGDYYKPSDLQAAERHRAEKLARHKLGLSLEEDRPGRVHMFEEVAQKWLDSVAVDADTGRGYSSMLNRYWMPVFRGKIIEEISRSQIIERVAELPLSPASKRTALTPLSCVFTHGGINPNPAAKIPLGKATKGRVDRYTPAERDAILGALDGQAKVYFSLLFATGMRPGEALALTWADYDGQYLYVCKQYTNGAFKDHTKTKVDRRVFVPSWCQAILNGHSTRLAGGNIFLTKHKKPVKRPSTLNKAWAEAHKKARVGAHPVRLRRPYTTRHTRASELLSRGVHPAEAAFELGQSVPIFLEVYARFVEEFGGKRDIARLEGETPHQQKTRNSETD